MGKEEFSQGKIKTKQSNNYNYQPTINQLSTNYYYYYYY